MKPTVCLLGRLDPIKRPWIFFELAKKFKNVDFLVCGRSSYPKVMNPIIEQYQSVENLKFLGLVEGENKADILSKSWVIVNTSIHEGLPCSFEESFAYGTPIISSVNPDDLVSKFGFYTGENVGYGTDEPTMKRFQEGLDKLLSDKKELERLGLEAREYIEKIYNFDVFEKSLRNILSDRFKINYAL
jgi:glycosyltransferase involved in cell wall biosynthesis